MKEEKSVEEKSMDIIYQKEKEKSYLVRRDEGLEMDFEMRMLCENHVPPFADCEQRSFNGERFFYYDITDAAALSERIKNGRIRLDQIKQLLFALMSAKKAAARFFLPPEGICLAPEFIFLRGDEVLFCYRCDKEASLKEGLLALAEQMMAAVDHEDEMTVVFVYQWYMLAKDASLSVDTLLKRLLCSEENGIESQKEGEEAFPEALAEEKEPADLEKSRQEFFPDSLTVSKKPVSGKIFFVLLMFLSVFYAIFLFWQMELYSMRDFFSKKEGLLAAVFFAFGLIGALFSPLFAFFTKNNESSH